MCIYKNGQIDLQRDGFFTFGTLPVSRGRFRPPQQRRFVNVYQPRVALSVVSTGTYSYDHLWLHRDGVWKTRTCDVEHPVVHLHNCRLVGRRVFAYAGGFICQSLVFDRKRM